ncbi:T9SS type A sorting domain-containing protein [Aequorivita sp. H23M31]|uniref:T9SS type A sorting domain-containing protein n=1 Tax=Aequorivita ciconiae TaxID=2494375 RepID=A0A410G2P9_9FLAO|nr:GEVED domain-containing protein [Aequorivita sp. H23M31]QAA81519.1 T9SS type A sorting domain-containing protein [Aequorivita sp. H23M31]
MNKRITFLFFTLLAFTFSWQGWAQTGSTCEDPVVVSSMPFTVTGNTADYGSNYSSSDIPPVAPGAITNGTSYTFYLNGDEAVYSYTAGANGFVDINLEGVGSYTGLFAFIGCPFSSTVGYHVGSGSGTRSIPQLPVIQGETYYIVISTWASPQSTAYTLSITGTDVADPPTCPRPTALTAANLTLSQADISWTAGGNESSWNVSWGPVGYTPGDSAEIGSEVASVTNYQITNLMAGTAYHVYVQADCGSGDLSFWSGPLNIYTGHCIPTTTGNSAYIESVTLMGGANQDVNNANTGPGENGSGYSDFSEETVMAIPEGTIEYSVVLQSGETAGLKIWVDYNNDLIFDASEMVFQSSSYNGSYSGSFTLPSSASGTLRMRIGSSYTPSGGPNGPCSHSGQGEYEDYSIQIIVLDSCTEAVAGTVVGDTEMMVCANTAFSMSVTGNSEPAVGLIRTWQSSPAGTGTWTDLDVSASTITIPGIEDATDYRYHVECSNGDIDNSEVIAVTINPNANECYCIPEATNTARYINNFSTSGGIENISNLESGFSPGGYGDFSDTQTVSQAVNESVAFEADVLGGSAGFKIWVDWNHDGAFTADEVAYASTSYNTSPSGSFEVPGGALEGETRMRIVSNWSSSTGNTDPCATAYTLGEFEDYTFNVIFPDTCSGEPEAGTAAVDPETGNGGTTYTVTATGYESATNLSFQWQSNTNGEGWIDEGGATEFHVPFTATAPSNVGDEVEWRLALTCTTSGETAYSEVATFTVTLVYCNATVSSVEAITRVIFAGIDNSSDAASTVPYEDFTAFTAEVEAGETYSFAAEGNTKGNYTNYFTVWVDWNHNGEFETEEMYTIGSIVNSTGSDGQQAISDILVPEDAVAGETRMRVIKNFNSARTNPCGSASFGQIEDYTVNVAGGEEPFPSPYCNIDESDGSVVVEEITKVELAGTTITNDNSTDVLIDKTDVIVDLISGNTYNLSVEGNTYGDFTTNIVAFIDWNQNGILDDEGEVYELGTLENSSGNDGISVSMDIEVPSGAVLGETRIRITKTYFDELSDAIVTPCGIQFDPFGMGTESGYGQALDFTLNIEEGEGPDCGQGDDSNNFENGYNITAGGSFRNADDFMVSPDNTLNVRSIVLNILSQGPLTSVDINFYNDNNGAPGSTVVEAVTGLVPYSQTVIGGAFGFDVYQVMLETDLEFEGGPNGATFWMQPVANGGTAYWEVTSVGTLGAPIHTSEAGGAWISDEDGNQAVFKLYCTVVDPPPFECNFNITSTVEPITRVQIANVDNSSPATSTVVLEDFTSIVINAEEGATLEVALEGNTAGSYTNYFTVFINTDSEQPWRTFEMFEIGSITNSTGTDGQQATATITLPSSLTAGEHLLRVVKNYNTSPLFPCASYSFGQGEDYTLFIGEMEDCSGTPDAGIASVNPTEGNPNSSYTVSASGYSTGNGLTYQWQSNTDGAGWIDEGVAEDHYSSYQATAPSGLGVSVEWRLEVTCSFSQETSYSEIATFTTAESMIYCTPELDCTDGDMITNVTFQEIDNTTSCSPNGYGDYTAMEATVQSGGTYPISVSVGNGWAYESVSVWIDFDSNGTFDEDEFFYIGTGSAQALTGNIAIPAGTTDGNYRMRVRVAAVGEASATWDMSCDEDQGYGETEDYTVVVDGVVGVQDYSNLNFSYHPNPMSEILNISANRTIESVSAYNVLGQQVISNKQFADGKVDVSTLPTGTYIFRVTFEGGLEENFKVLKQ